jgi:V/A-type H+-transporting ATPase subunit E
MDAKLENLIEKIRSEGIEEAKKSAGEIIENARKEALSISKDTQKEADKIIEDAKKKADKLISNAEASIKQAQRDSVLTVKEQLTKLFDRVLQNEISNVLSPDFLKNLISEYVKNASKGEELEFVVSEEDKEKLQNLLLAKTKESLKEPVTFKVDKGISKGFRVGIKDSNVYYDFTDESLADFLKEFLNPALREILDKDNG